MSSVDVNFNFLPFWPMLGGPDRRDDGCGAQHGGGGYGRPVGWGGGLHPGAFLPFLPIGYLGGGCCPPPPSQHSHGCHEHHECGDDKPDNDCCDGDSTADDIKPGDWFELKDDPHFKYEINGHEGNGTTRGGMDGLINAMDTEELDIKLDFVRAKGDKSWTESATVEIGREGCEDVIEVNAKTNEITLNGRDISSELSDGVHCFNGNKITKDGNCITISTADGETITIKDDGGRKKPHLDVKFESDGMQINDSDSGMIVDAARGKDSKELENADDYKVDEDSSCDDCSHDATHSSHGYGMPYDPGFALATIGFLKDCFANMNVSDMCGGDAQQLLSSLRNFLNAAEPLIQMNSHTMAA